MLLPSPEDKGADMASIEKRKGKDGRATYRAKVRLRGFPPQTASFYRLPDAKHWAAQTEADIRAGIYLPKREAQCRTLSELIDRYVAKKLPEKGASTQQGQKMQLEWWCDQLGSLTLGQITPAKLNDCSEALLDGKRGPATVNRYLAVMGAMFTYAVKDLGWIEDSPMRKLTKHKEPRGRVRFLSNDERKTLLDACKASSNTLLYPAVMLALSTGMRQGEQFGLTWKQVDLSTGRIILEETKNDERRTAVATGPALDELKKLAKVRLLDNEHVFPGKKRGAAIELKRPFSNALKEAGIEDFHWHDLRHSFASELAMSGATLAELAEAMGHKTLVMVKRYSHLTEGHISKVVERMTAKVFGGEA